jgi:D-alanyl-D-alanine carboxypeptidase
MLGSSLPDQVRSSIEALVRSHLSEAPVPGVAVGIVRDGDLVDFLSLGNSDRESGAIPTMKSIARVASVTKTFTATAIMQMRDASLLALDDPLLLYIPEFTIAQAVAGPLESVTIRRMLTHHSGLSTEHPDLDWNAADFPTNEHLMDSLEKIQVVIPQDSQWKYSNLAYALLGEVVSRLSGKPYVDYVHDEIIVPVGLANTAFDLSTEQEKLKMTGYSPALPGEQGFRIAPSGHLKGFTSAGQLHSNIEDLAKWIAFQLGGSPETVLSPASRKEMHRPNYVGDDWSWGQGLGWRAIRLGERVYLNHGGALHGFSTNVIFNVPERTGVITLVNMWPTGLPSDLALRIAEIVIDGNPSQSGAAISVSNVDPPAPTDFDGKYFAEPGLPITINGDGCGGLAFAKPAFREPTLHAPARLEPAGEPDAFRIVNGRGAGEIAVFTRSEVGAVTGFTYRRIGLFGGLEAVVCPLFTR